MATALDTTVMKEQRPRHNAHCSARVLRVATVLNAALKRAGSCHCHRNCGAWMATVINAALPLWSSSLLVGLDFGFQFFASALP
jgi:hypothetical protein